ncbi:hypothetical protein KKC87_04545 [Patescibacteria group bacterium]|nr:hypothetical protein [Patescibacteria group bacterium]
MDRRLGYHRCLQVINSLKGGSEYTMESFTTELSKILSSNKYTLRRYIFLMENWKMINVQGDKVIVTKKHEKESTI